MANNSIQIDLTHWIYRLIAYIIDSIIIGIPAAIIYYSVIIGLITRQTRLQAYSVILGFIIPHYTNVAVTVTYGAAPWWGFLLFPFILGILELFYFVILDVVWGRTIGKRVMGLQVQTEKGDKIDLGKSIIRNISKIYGVLLFLDWLIAVITPGNDKRQKFTDRMAGTTVIQTKTPFTTTPPPL